MQKQKQFIEQHSKGLIKKLMLLHSISQHKSHNTCFWIIMKLYWMLLNYQEWKIQYPVSIVNQMMEWKFQNNLSKQNKIQILGTENICLIKCLFFLKQKIECRKIIKNEKKIQNIRFVFSSIKRLNVGE
jgi:hypothetical protein